MVKYEMKLEIEYPDTIKQGYTGLFKIVEDILKTNMNLMIESLEGKDLLPTKVSTNWISGFDEAYRSEARYYFEEYGLYEEGEPGYDVVLTEDDYQEISDTVSNDDWLNSQIGEVIRDTVMNHVLNKLEDSDNNE